MGLGVLNLYPVVLIKFASATILRVCPTPLIQLLHITPKLRLHGGIIPTPLPSYNPSWLMTSPAVIQLAPRGSWTGRISPAAVARSVGSLPHWAKGLGGSPGAREVSKHVAAWKGLGNGLWRVGKLQNLQVQKSTTLGRLLMWKQCFRGWTHIKGGMVWGSPWSSFNMVDPPTRT